MPPSITLVKVQYMYHQRDMESKYGDPTVVPTVYSKDWPQNLEATVEYIRGFRGVDGNPISYVIRQDLFPELAAQDPIRGTIGSKYFTIDEDMISRGPIIEGTEVAGTDHDNLDPFINAFMSDRTRVWDKLCAIFHQSEAWT